MARWVNFDDPQDQIFHLLQQFNGLLGQELAAEQHAHGSTTAEARYPNASLPEELLARCRSLIVQISHAIDEAEQTDVNTCYLLWLSDQKQRLTVLLPRPPRCHILELPAELREAIWVHAITEWTPISRAENTSATRESNSHSRPFPTSDELVRSPIRMDRFNRPLPPALTSVCHQVRGETLHLYYQHNIFECWRPLFWLKDWSQSTFIDWLLSLGPQRTQWLREINLMYKHENELEHDIMQPLLHEGFQLQQVIINSKRELSEYEMCFEEMGLPRHFGSKRRSDRWLVGASS